MLTSNQKTPSVIGGVLLVTGNVVGAGILALPIALAQLGLFHTVLVLSFFWLLMMLGAYYFLEANLALPPGTNLISMSRAALGKWGVIIAWFCNLLVMYSLISAYVAGGGDLIKTNLGYVHITFPSWIYPVIFLAIFGVIVSRGMYVTDYTNRLLMLIKAAIFLTVVAGLATHVNLAALAVMPQYRLSGSLLIIAITSFGFATLIPSLRSYYHSDVKKIKMIIFWGTFIPLLCYLLWTILIFSVIPYGGDYGLKHMQTSVHAVSDLQSSLSKFLQATWIAQAANLFGAICIITSFLANSISLTHFIADGFGIYRGMKVWLVYFLAYFPPLCAVLFYPKAFLMGLSLAGILAVIQLLILPGIIVWVFRNSAKNADLTYAVSGGKLLLGLLLSASVIILLVTLFSG